MEKWFLKLLKEANDENTTKQRLTEIAAAIASTNDPYAICDFCEFCERVDDPEIMPILQKPMESLSNPLHTYEFVYLMAECGRKYVNYSSLLQRIIDVNDPKLICYCREFVPVLDHVRLDTAMSRVGNHRWLHYYDEVTGFSKANTLEAKMLKSKTQKIDKLYSEGKSVVSEIIRKRVDLKNGAVGIYNAALSSLDPYFISHVLENFPSFDSSGRLSDKLVSLGDVMSVYEWGASCTSADIKKVERATIASGQPKYMYYVAAYCPGANVASLLNAVKNASGVPDFVKEKYIKKIEEHISSLNSSGELGDDE